MINQVNNSPVNFKATLIYTKVNNNLEKWEEVAEKFAQKTADYPKYEIALNEKKDTLILKRIRKDKTKEKIVKGTFKRAGSLQSLLLKGTDYTANYFKRFLEKHAKDQIVEDQAYAMAAKIEKKTKTGQSGDLGYYADDVFGGF